MRIVLVVFGVLVLLAGSVWTLQGAGFIPGSFMSNNPTWIWFGTITAVVGLGVFAFGIRSRPHPQKNPPDSLRKEKRDRVGSRRAIPERRGGGVVSRGRRA